MEGLQQITYGELLQWQREGKAFQLIDVREQWERDRFNIGGAHLPMAEIFNCHSQISTHIPVVIYCEKGIRSALVIQRLQLKYGFGNLLNLARGMQMLKLNAGSKALT